MRIEAVFVLSRLVKLIGHNAKLQTVPANVFISLNFMKFCHSDSQKCNTNSDSYLLKLTNQYYWQ